MFLHVLGFVQSRLIDYTTYMWLGFSMSLVTMVIIVTHLRSQRQMPPGIESVESSAQVRFPWLVAALLILIAMRIWAIWQMNSNWFIQDDAFDACIMPYQMLHNEPIWGGGTNYLTYLSYLAVFQLFDFSVRIASAVNVAVFIFSFLLIAYAIWREFGSAAALFVVATCAVSYPLILHSAYATAITFAFLPLGGMLVVLSRPANLMSGLFLSILLAVSLFLYPGGTLVGLCLIASHAVLMRRWWNLHAWIGLAAGGIFGGGCAYFARKSFSSPGRMTQWAGGFLQFDKIGESVLVVLRDTFCRSISWNTYNGKVPYFEPILFGWLICGLLFLVTALVRRRMGKEERWIAIAFLVFFGSAILSAMTGVYPGVRRIVSAIPLLYLVCAIVFARLWNSSPRSRLIPAVAMVGWALLMARSVAFASHHWPLSKESGFMAESSLMLRNAPEDTRRIVILSYPNDQFEGLQYRCSLGLTKEFKRRFDPPEIVRRDQINTRLLSGGLTNPFVLLSFDTLPGNRLAESMGRSPTETCRLYRCAVPDPGHLAEVHFFRALGGGEGDPAVAPANATTEAPRAEDRSCCPPPASLNAIDWLHSPPPERGIRGLVFLEKSPLTSLRSLRGRTPDFDIVTDTPAITETHGVLTTSDGRSLQGSDNLRIVFAGKWLARGVNDTVFRVRADDGCRVYLDDEVIVDYDGTHSFAGEAVSKPLRLKKGWHAIVVDYFEWGGNAGLSVEWKGVGKEFAQLKSGLVLP